MPALGVVYHLPSPGLCHSAQHAGIFSTAYTLVGEHLGIMAAYVLHHPERFSAFLVDKPVFGTGGDLLAELVDKIACVRNIFGFFELSAAGLPEFLAYAGLQFGKFTPGFQDFRIITEGCDAGSHKILVSGFGHKRELARNYGHGCFLWNCIGMIGYSSAGGVVGGFIDVPAQHIAAYLQEVMFRRGEETLPDATPYIEPVIVRNLFLVIRPYFLFALIYHSEPSSLLKCPLEQCSKVYFVYSSMLIPISSAFLREHSSTRFMRSVAPVSSKMAWSSSRSS